MLSAQIDMLFFYPITNLTGIRTEISAAPPPKYPPPTLRYGPYSYSGHHSVIPSFRHLAVPQNTLSGNLSSRT